MVLWIGPAELLADTDSLQRSVDAFLPFGVAFGVIGIGVLLVRRYKQRRGGPAQPALAESPVDIDASAKAATPAVPRATNTAEKKSAPSRTAGKNVATVAAVDDSQANLLFHNPPGGPPKRPDPRKLAPAPGRTGRYVVSGTDSATKMQTTWRVQAEGPDDARKKGEREGIVVDAVQLDEE